MAFYRGGEKVKINGREAIVLMDSGVCVYTIDPNEKEFSGIDSFDKSKVDIERLDGDKHMVEAKGMSKNFGAWELTILDVKVCKPRKTIKVIASHPLLDSYAVKFDRNDFYEFTHDEKAEKYLVEPTDCKYCIPFSPEKFHEYFEDVTMEVRE